MKNKLNIWLLDCRTNTLLYLAQTKSNQSTQHVIVQWKYKCWRKSDNIEEAELIFNRISVDSERPTSFCIGRLHLVRIRYSIYLFSYCITVHGSKVSAHNGVYDCVQDTRIHTEKQQQHQHSWDLPTSIRVFSHSGCVHCPLITDAETLNPRGLSRRPRSLLWWMKAIRSAASPAPRRKHASVHAALPPDSLTLWFIGLERPVTAG